MPTHFTNGVSDVVTGNPLYELGVLDPTKYHTYWDDFDTTPIAAQWTLTATSAGSGTSAITVPDADGGLARILQPLTKMTEYMLSGFLKHLS